MGVSYLLSSPPTDLIGLRVMRVFEIFFCVCVSVYSVFLWKCVSYFVNVAGER